MTEELDSRNKTDLNTGGTRNAELLTGYLTSLTV